MIIFSDQQCALCQSATKTLQHQLCQQCYQLLPLIEHGCKHCGISISAEQDYCGRCLKRRFAFDQLSACFEFKFPIQSITHQFKYHDRLAHGQLLSEISVNQLKATLTTEQLPEALIPIPLHWRKQVHRGYNQATEITKVFSKQLKLPALYQTLRKKQATDSQSTLPFKARQKNIRHAFQCSTSVPDHVALIDDVATSCATVHEAAKTLKQQGASRVDVWCLARVNYL